MEENKLDKAHKDWDKRYEHLPPSMRVIYRMLADTMEKILSQDCTEDEIADILTNMNPETQGYKREDDYVTVDKGMKILGMGKNRVGFTALMRKFGIVNERFNNVPIGYNRRKILSLKHKTEEEYQERLNKQRNKKLKQSNKEK